MSLLSTARLRPTRKKGNSHTRQFISFRLRAEWFALPIGAVERITALGELHGDADKTGVGLTLYQGQPLVVVDVGHYLFGEAATLTHWSPEQLLLVTTDPQGQFVGIPIDSQPVLRKIQGEQIQALPERYQTSGIIRCISASAVSQEENTFLFLLDTGRLFELLSSDSSPRLPKDG